MALAHGASAPLADRLPPSLRISGSGGSDETPRFAEPPAPIRDHRFPVKPNGAMSLEEFQED